MNRYRLQLILDQFQREKERARYEDAWPWVGVLLAFLLALLPTDFQDYLNIKASVWEALTLIGTFGVAFMVAWTVYKARKNRHEKAPSAQDVVHELVEEMRLPEHEHIHREEES